MDHDEMSRSVEKTQAPVEKISAFNRFLSLDRLPATRCVRIVTWISLSILRNLSVYLNLRGSNSYLEETLGRKVDLVTPEALRKEFRDDILREAIRAA